MQTRSKKTQVFFVLGPRTSGRPGATVDLSMVRNISPFESIPKDIFNYEIKQYLIDIDLQILRKVSTVFRDLIPLKTIKFNSTNIEMIHLKRYQSRWSTDTIYNIASLGKLDELQYIHIYKDYIHNKSGYIKQDLYGKTKCECGFYSAKYGHLDCFEYALKNCYIDTAISAEAARGGHLNCLKIIPHEQFDIRSIIQAATNGHTECIKYIFSITNLYAPLLAVFCAARNKHYKCLKYLCKHGAPINDFVLKAAKEGGDEKCIQYIAKLLN